MFSKGRIKWVNDVLILRAFAFYQKKKKTNSNKPLIHKKEFLIIWCTIWVSNGRYFSDAGESHYMDS